MSISVEEFSESLIPQEVKGIVVLQLAMTMGVVLFAAAVVFISLSQEPIKEITQEDLDRYNMMSIMAGFMSVSALMAAIVIGKVRMNANAIFQSENPKKQFWVLFRSTKIIQLAVMEGAALFGLVTCFMAMTEGAMKINPGYWGNMFPALLLVLFSLATFPSKGNIIRKFKQIKEVSDLG